MPTFRIVAEFRESNGATFNEVYYKDATDADAASRTAPSWDNARVALLHPLNTFVRIRASQVDANRITAQNNIARNGEALATSSPLPVGSAAVLALAGATASRKLWLRGLPLDWYIRDKISGRDNPPPAFLAALTTFYDRLKFQGFGSRKLTPSAVTGFFKNRKILSVDGTAGNGLSLVTLEEAPGYPVPSRVVIGGASKKDLPALNGHYQVLAVVGAVVTINYQTPNKAKIDGGAAKMRQEAYSGTDVFVPGKCGFDHYGTRTSKNPLSRSRGAKRAARIRNLA